jgi:hypothetical protein
MVKIEIWYHEKHNELSLFWKSVIWGHLHLYGVANKKRAECVRLNKKYWKFIGFL